MVNYLLLSCLQRLERRVNDSLITSCEGDYQIKNLDPFAISLFELLGIVVCTTESVISSESGSSRIIKKYYLTELGIDYYDSLPKK